ncbi:sigma-70 family RNA polymerase sigma factor [Amycolatopsis sp. OK19-0408]|uniref:Sigma-70 family RNA polymerase sigma factor n=1 Tax=Amycolatopsis iheyensis TaxID=2945988 RepID=A0A9X2NK84_9PSEU|nr:sigma-70 family RNA polymerase sigma factor [Amycolatopsis iheyensis]MCR6488315.1 sigma-70 family RNA polymerase sigma factor [Amycolatopsis iheyensis]
MDFPHPETDVDERGFYVRATPDFVASSDVFALARTTFAWLVTGPEPVSVDGREIAELPSRPVPLNELGTLLLAGDCPQTTRDAVWAHLITRARAENGADGGTWTMACVGLALPVLLRVAALVTRRFTGDTHDLNAAVLAGFLQGLHEVDLTRPAILAHLYWAARAEGRRALREATAHPIPVDDLEFGSAPPPRQEDHPDLVLAEAVRAGAITTEEAGLISETRVGEVPLADAAHARGVRYKTAQQRRNRAEHRLVAYLNEQDDATLETPVDRRLDTAAGHPLQRRPNSATAPASSRHTHRLKSRTVTDAAGEPATDVGAPVSPHGPKSPIASCGTRVPADRRPRARRTASGPAAPTRREVRSCD